MRLFLLLSFAILGAECGFQTRSMAGDAIDRKHIGYAMGVVFGAGLRKQGIEGYADLPEVMRGIQDVLPGGTPRMTETEARVVLDRLQAALETEKAAAAQDQETRNRLEGEDYLKQNAQRVGVNVLPSGLQYRVLEEGAGPKPGTNDAIWACLVGRLLDGTEFQKAPKLGVPNVSMKRSQANMIAGLREALGLMRTGDRWELVVPPELGFKSIPYGSKVTPGATLLYDLKISSVIPAGPEQAKASNGVTLESKPNQDTPTVGKE